MSILLQESDEYANNLKSIIQELREKVLFYIPIYDDSLDVCLANYLNQYCEKKKAKSLFVRES